MPFSRPVFDEVARAVPGLDAFLKSPVAEINPKLDSQISSLTPMTSPLEAVAPRLAEQWKTFKTCFDADPESSDCVQNSRKFIGSLVPTYGSISSACEDSLPVVWKCLRIRTDNVDSCHELMAEFENCFRKNFNVDLT